MFPLFAGSKFGFPYHSWMSLFWGCFIQQKTNFVPMKKKCHQGHPGRSTKHLKPKPLPKGGRLGKKKQPKQGKNTLSPSNITNYHQISSNVLHVFLHSSPRGCCSPSSQSDYNPRKRPKVHLKLRLTTTWIYFLHRSWMTKRQTSTKIRTSQQPKQNMKRIATMLHYWNKNLAMCFWTKKDSLVSFRWLDAIWQQILGPSTLSTLSSWHCWMWREYSR